MVLKQPQKKTSDGLQLTLSSFGVPSTKEGDLDEVVRMRFVHINDVYIMDNLPLGVARVRWIGGASNALLELMPQCLLSLLFCVDYLFGLMSVWDFFLQVSQTSPMGK